MYNKNLPFSVDLRIRYNYIFYIALSLIWILFGLYVTNIRLLWFIVISIGRPLFAIRIFYIMIPCVMLIYCYEIFFRDHLFYLFRHRNLLLSIVYISIIEIIFNALIIFSGGRENLSYVKMRLLLLVVQSCSLNLSRVIFNSTLLIIYFRVVFLVYSDYQVLINEMLWDNDIIPRYIESAYARLSILSIILLFLLSATFFIINYTDWHFKSPPTIGNKAQCYCCRESVKEICLGLVYTCTILFMLFWLDALTHLSGNYTEFP